MGKRTNPIENPELVRFLQQLVIQALCDLHTPAKEALYEWVWGANATILPAGTFKALGIE